MSSAFDLIVLGLVAAQIFLPAKWAFLPLVISGFHLANIEIIPQFTPARILIAVGLFRAIASGRFRFSVSSRLDMLFAFFGLWTLISAAGHQADEWTPSPFIARAGWVFNIFGAYLYGRAFLPDFETFRRYAGITPIILAPLAAGLTIEKTQMRNVYSTLGAATESVLIREGKVRAVGPFRHPILAGTAGATALPFAFLLWRERRRLAALATSVSCLLIVLASASSGPLAAVGVSIAGVLFWPWRHHTRKLIVLAIIVSIAYVLYSGRGPWYLMTKIDLVGGSTGWHRAHLIDQAFEHLGEWWLWGTDYTRHWMPTGMRWNPNHADITNYFLHIGIIAGFPATLALVGFIYGAMRRLFARMKLCQLIGATEKEFLLWIAATSLATHAISFVSISYFDQMYIYFYILIALIFNITSNGTNFEGHTSDDRLNPGNQEVQ